MEFKHYLIQSTLLLVAVAWLQLADCSERSFTIDHKQNEFLKDGKVFRYVSGSMHYFRTPAPLWRDRLRKMKFGGMNAVQTYVEWSSHEPVPGKYNFTGDNDLVKFIQIAQEEGLLVLLRPGPYICAERDMGGLPSWLLKTNPKMVLRSSHVDYIKAVDRWFKVLMPLMKPLMYHNGGPIIMVQVENEYGSYFTCDFQYTSHLRDLLKQELGNETLLYTTDGSGDGYLKCGKIPDVFVTIDFGPGGNATKTFEVTRRHQATGPLVNSEYYSGWIDYWETRHSMRSNGPIVKELDEMLSLNASVNIYMYHGGTNFGMSACSNNGGTYTPCPTSYDYDSPISEAGDLTSKFFAIRDVVKKYMPVDDPKTPIANATEKMQVPQFNMEYKASIFDVLPQNPVQSDFPKSFEELDFAHGFMMYSTKLPFHAPDPAVMVIPGLRDRAQVFVDREYQGTLSRTQKYFTQSLLTSKGSAIDILVENQGRNSFGSNINEMKGIIGNVTVSKKVLQKWSHYKLFDDWNNVIDKILSKDFKPIYNNLSNRVPSFYVGNFTLPNKANYPLDSFLDVPGWNKGVAILNGHNLGRYWPVAGPQITLYAPSLYFKPYPEVNYLTLFEIQKSPCVGVIDGKCAAQFVKVHSINGDIPIAQLKVKPNSVNVIG